MMHLSKPLTVPLFVPGHRPELLSKAAASGADAVIMDLEDAVSEADKPAAHEALAARSTLRVPLVVRCNGFGSIWFEKDLEVLAETPPDMVMLPKAESASHIEAIAQKLGSEMPIIPIIESAFGLGADLVELLPCAVALGHVWRGKHRAGGTVLRNLVRLGFALRREAVDAAGHLALFVVGHVVAAHVAVMPVGNEHRAVGGGADVGRAVPRILAREHVDRLAGVAGTAALDWVGAHHARAGVAVHHLPLKNGRQQFALVDRDAGW